MLKVKNVSKSFPGVKSLDDVSFSAESGEIHAVVGENGAGKSTLMKIIAGAYRPDAGVVELENRERRWASPHEAQAAGVHIIHQELVLFPDLTVSENVMIGRQPRGRFGFIDKAEERRVAVEQLRMLGHSLDPDILVRELSVADRQMVEVAKAMVGEAKVLILDEPTAVISGHEIERLFERMRGLREAGVSIIYISHRLEEIFEIADRVTVLKDGRLVDTRPVSELSRDRLITLMVGRTLSDLYPGPKPVPAGAPEVLRVADASVAGLVRGVSFALKKGEILGVAGLVGARRTELAHGIFGSTPLTGGSLYLDGKKISPVTPEKAIAAGIGFLTEDRKAEGLCANMPVAANVTAPQLGEISTATGLDHHKEHEIALEVLRRYAIAARSPRTEVVGLSGGNQQKALFGRWVRACHKVLILDEPTRGVDVGAKAEIYRIIRSLADDGLGVLMISSELPEIIGLCDRVIVMREGVLTGELSGKDVTEERILHYATLGAEGQDAA